MKKLSNYIVLHYLIVTVVPLLLLAAMLISSDVEDAEGEYQQHYSETIEYQLIQAKYALLRFDLQMAEQLVNTISQLEYVSSVRLDSLEYDLTMAEQITDIDATEHNDKRYRISNDDSVIGYLVVTKNDSKRLKNIYSELYPKLFLSLLVLLAISLVFSRKVLLILANPFQDIQRYALSISRGDFDIEAPKKTYHEFVSLFDSLDVMKVRLKKTIHALQENEERLLQATTHLEKQLITDSLTNIYNRVGFNRFIDEVVQEKYEHFSLMMMDLNGFKQINDQHGHFSGDYVLVEVSKRISSLLTQAGTLYRLGGDEFSIVLKGEWQPQELKTLAKLIQMRIADAYLYENKELYVSVSIGGIQYRRSDNDDIEKIIHQADLAMYQAKALQIGYMVANLPSNR
ncbi:diguanylate cyclase domain-containing protein [Aliivibrio kagoshimensis]|uniref:GGDEF domain-containing protein n=1 Tax=Aliivibrio kagoshimensis TaxID=2910230 RepID=UPI003D0F4D2A